eukprot:gene14955-biopygen12465
MHLIAKDLWEIVQGTEVLRSGATADQQRIFRKRENIALATVCLSVDTSLQIYVRSATSSKEAWDNLQKHFEQKTLSQKIFYRRKLYSAKMAKGAKMIDHVNYLKTLAEHLEAVDDAIVEKDLVIILISSLPEEYNYLITALETIAEDKLTWDYVRDRLIHEFEKLHGEEQCGSGTTNVPDMKNKIEDNALFIKRGTDKGNPSNGRTFLCHYCKKPGHFARNCYKKKSDLKGKSGHASANIATTIEESKSKSLSSEIEIPQAEEIALTAGDVPTGKDNWWIDSGATQHMTSDKKQMTDYVAFKKTTTKKGVEVQFKGQSCKVVINDKVYNIGHKHGKLYKLNLEPENTCCYASTKATDDLSLWHNRFGHLGYDNLKMLSDKSMVDGMEHKGKTEMNKECESCAFGKQNRSPFPKKSSHRCTQPLELIHSDVCGPMNEHSVGGSKKFKEFVALNENLTGRRVKKLRADNGGEYKSDDFEKYCKERGILREDTIPYTPQQNGVAERMNRTIMETVRSIMHHAKLPMMFWAEAVSTAVYIRNRCPTSALKEKTPYESWLKEKPSVKHLRVFGCNAMVHIPDEKRSKLDKKSRKCIFVGYPTGSKGYKLFDPETRKMIRSRDVIFMENSFGDDSLKKEDISYQLLPDDKGGEVTMEMGHDNVEATNIEFRNQEQQEEREIELSQRQSQRVRQPPERYGIITGDCLAIANKFDMDIHQMDVKTAFLNGYLTNDIYMKQPEGYEDEENPHLVCKLQKSLYAEKIELKKRFEMDDLGEINYCLGMSIKRDRRNRVLTINQNMYLKNVLKRFQMQDCKPISTPMDPNAKFMKLTNDDEVADKREYQAMIGSLTYASIATRPDLSDAVGILSQFMSNPGQQHVKGVKRVLRYIQGTLDYGLRFEGGEFKLQGYSDADWAGDVNTRKSTSGYVFRLGKATISWKSKRQPVVALSSTEAEYVALCAATQEAIWLRRLLGSLDINQDQATQLYEDNQGAIALSRNPNSHSRTKHIDIKYHYVRDVVDNKEIQLIYCPTEKMIADIMTKPLPRQRFEEMRSLIGVEQLL